MKKRILASLLAVCLVVALLPTAAFAADYEYGRTDGEQFYLCTINELSYTTFFRGSPKEPTTIAAATFISTDNIPKSFDALYGMFSNPETNIEYTQTKTRYAPDSTVELTAKLAITSTTSLAMMMTNLSGDALNVTASQKIEVNGRNARIGTSNINDTVTLNVPGISVTNGNLLIRNGKWTKRESTPIPGTSQALVVKLSEPITVGEGGALYLEIREGVATNIAGLPSTLDVQDKIIAPSGKSAIEINGGEVHIGAFLVESAEGDSETTNSPLINVTSGTLVIELGAPTVSKPDENGMPVYDGSGQGAPSEKWHSEISSNTNKPAIAVASGATLTLKGGEITSTAAGTPAIQVASGGTVEIPTDSKAVVTASDNSAQAIDLANGANVKKGTMEITVSQENGGEGDNYVDNYGNIILAAGATAGSEKLNAAVILADGTIIEGNKNEAPEVSTGEDGTTTVTVPEGGSVQKPNEEKTTLTAGGSVSSTGSSTEVTANPVNAIGVTLSQTSLNLVYDGEHNTETLTATLSPEGAEGTVSWRSSDERVATVDGGKVTAVGVGSATITATVKDSEGRELARATCTVNVRKEPVPATGIRVEPATAVIYVGGTTQLTATVEPETATDKTIAWSSSNKSVATVDANGVVTAVSAGTATITATAGSCSATCTVTVTSPYIPVPPVLVTPGKPVEPDEPDEPDNSQVWTNPYTDVSVNDWFYASVAYVSGEGIMSGVSAAAFAPNDAMTRAMVWTVLARVSGKNVDGGSPWYAPAQSWAMVNGVSDGTEPSGSITREQLVTMLYRYAGSPGAGVSELAKLSQFTDSESVSDWAQEAMAWAVSAGVINGTDGRLAPQGSATRAQVAAILMRYLENVQK